jgi:hypothetical protein
VARNLSQSPRALNRKKAPAHKKAV